MVLIDTWWNVNFTPRLHCWGQAPRFNRYMVECEFGSVALTFLLILVLIDTWWNVNVGYQDMLSVGLEF